MARFGKTAAGIAALRSEMDGLNESAERTSGTMGRARAALSELNSAIEGNKAKADQFRTQTDRLVDDAQRGKAHLDVLDGLYAQNQQIQNVFSEKFGLFIEAVRIGALDVNKLKQEMGDASIVVDGELTRIRDLFSGADLGKYRQDIQDFVLELTSGKASIGDAIEFIEQRAGNLAKGLINVLKLFQQGKATIEDVQRALDAAKKTFPPGGESGALLEAIEDEILGGA